MCKTSKFLKVTLLKLTCRRFLCILNDTCDTGYNMFKPTSFFTTFLKGILRKTSNLYENDLSICVFQCKIKNMIDFNIRYVGLKIY